MTSIASCSSGVTRASSVTHRNRIRLSWSITLLALLLLPIFVLPARRMGARLAHMEREAANHNAAMTTQMTERFSAPGATLVKLFGRPAHEEAEFGSRAERVIVLSVGLGLAPFHELVLPITVTLLAAAAWITVVQRVLSVRQQLRAS